MNTEVEFSCSNGNALLGTSFVMCLPSGNWSAAIPTCESKYPEFNYTFHQLTFYRLTFRRMEFTNQASWTNTSQTNNTSPRIITFLR